MSSNVVSLNPLFTPAQIQGCQLWLDAADPTTITTSGSTMTGWTDKSGTGKTVSFFNTNTYTANVSVNTNNGTSAFFRANVDLRKTTATYANIFTVHTWAGSATSATQGLWGADDGGGWNRTQILSFPPAPEYAYGLAYTGVSPFVLTVSAVNTPSRTLYSANYAYLISNGTFATVNGTSTSTVSEAAASSQTTSQFTNFGATGSNANIGTVNFHEIIIYTSSTSNITTAQRQQVEGYLAWKWGLTGSLPANHPFKTYPPTNTIYTIPPSLRAGFGAAMAPSSSPFVFFRPTSVGGCSLWLDAADTSSITLSGSNVSQWRDKSGNGYTATGTVAPTYNANTRYILFNGSSQYFTVSDGAFPSGNNPYSIFIVAFSRNLANPQWIFFGGNQSVNQAIGAVFFTTNAIYHSWWVNEFRVDNSVSNNTSALLNLSYSTTRSIIVNGGTATTNSPGATRNNPTTPNYIGQRLSAEYLDGGIGEFIIYNSEIASSQRQQVEGYLAWKWGLQGSLPANHPYKNAVPGLPIPSLPPTRQMANRFWTPTSITGCSLWFDAADPATVLTSGSNVSQWNDKSGNTRNATGGVSPTFSNNGVIFNGSSSYLATTYTAVPSAESFFSVATWTGSVDRNYCIIGTSATNGRNYNVFQSGGSNVVKWDAWGVGGYAPTAGVQTNVRFLTSGIFNGSTGTTGLNGGSQTAPVSFSFSGTGTTNIGTGVLADYYQGTINEIICYNVALSTAQRQQIEGYLAWKWGLQGNLPANHPWKRWPPPSS